MLLWITYPLAVVCFYPIIRLKKRSPGLYFLFDRYALGGAQRVHLDILSSVEDIPKTVYFTRKSKDDTFRQAFYEFPNTVCKDVHVWCDYLLFRVFSVHYFSLLLNRQSGGKVLGSNSTFFYDMLPFLSRSIMKIELLHNFSFGKKGMEFFGLANVRYLDKRLVIDEATRENIFGQYERYDVDTSFKSKVQVIEFGVNIPAKRDKADVPPLRILYAGRGGEQKRIDLLNKVAEHFIPHSPAFQFCFAGSMGSELSDAVKAHYEVSGEVKDNSVMSRLFQEAHVIILTSAYEGFPVVVKEAMAHGCVPVVVALEGIKTHLTNGYNALLIGHPEDRSAVISGAIEAIQSLSANRNLLQRLSSNAYDYAANNFTKSKFFLRYRELLTSA